MKNNRQKYRKTLALISLLLLPITISYISPIAIAKGAEAGILGMSIIITVAIFISSLFFGRIWCSYLCPVGGVQEAYFKLKLKKASNRFNWLKVLFWIPWLGIIAIGLLKVGGFNIVDPLFMTKNGVSILHPGVLPVYYVLITSTLLMSLIFGRRAFCHYGCPISFFPVLALKIRDVFKLPSLRIAGSKDKCKECGACVKACPMSHNITLNVQHGRQQYITECINCAECIDACPNSALYFSWTKPRS
ncbi:4Fe-4S binding protein [Candidatus Margulisiibacteriota bacterium]